jgi:hypothetical protein
MAHNYNKLLQEIVYEVFERHCLEGHWPKVNFSKSNEGGFKSTSFSLFEYGSANRPYFYAVHRYIIDVLGDGYGIYTKRRNKAFIEQMRALIDQPVLTPKDLQVGDRVKLQPLTMISREYREGSIGNLDMLESDDIVDLVDCAEEHGYQDTYGSCYTNEIVLVKRDGYWRPFEGKGEQVTIYPEWAGG